MKIIENQKLTVASGDVINLTLNNGKSGDVSVAEVYVRTLAAIPFTAKGFVGDETTGVALKSMDVANFEVKSSITTAGIYQLLTGAFQRLEITFTGAGTVYVERIF